MPKFKVVSPFEPKGDQIKAISKLSDGINNGEQFQTLMGVTGSGKTYTMAKVVEQVQKPTLVLAHNKTLAAQLANEFRSFFPNNAVEYFVSYYDYYQPEAYVPGRDLFIEKDSSINDDIDKLRHSATASLFERRDVIVVASVSCIYGLGSPYDYKNLHISLRPKMKKDRDELLTRLVDTQYVRNDMDFHRGTFRVRGDVVEIFNVESTNTAIRVEFFGDEIERISEIHAITGEVLGLRKHVSIFPASHYVTSKENLERALTGIEEELEQRVEYFHKKNRLIEAQRILQRTNYDIEMLKEMGYCNGIENYTRHINNLEPGQPPYTLIDYFPEDFLFFVDESHVTLPQVRGMYGGDYSRKNNLVDYGFRLPSAFDNRPLNFEEFEKKINQIVFVSATPGSYEKEHSKYIIEQIVRPTGLVDPQIEIVPIKGQIDHLIGEINEKVDSGSRVLVTTLTKRMAEDLTDYLKDTGIKVRYLHSDIDTLERMQIIKELRLGVFDVLVGINLLREGLDIPEVALVAILDADKEGFLRSDTSLIQTTGRASRNVNGKVIMYADKITGSMRRAIDETDRRREKQQQYNIDNDITPVSIKKEVHDIIEAMQVAEDPGSYGKKKKDKNVKEDVISLIDEMKNEMEKAAKDLNFERAAQLRDAIEKIMKDSE